MLQIAISFRRDRPRRTGLQLRDSDCDYPCVWCTVDGEKNAVCYEWESCHTRLPGDRLELIADSERIYMQLEGKLPWT